MSELNILDVLKRIKRLPQVVLPKDAAIIAAYTGLSPGWNVLDAGTGSGFLAMFIANLVKPGKVLSYEKNKEFADNVKKQIKKLDIKNLKIINKDIFKAEVSGKFDLVTLDLKYAEKLIPKIFNVIKHNGYIAVYSPYIEQVKAVTKSIRKMNFADIKTVENIVREWKVDEFTHPVPSGILHTGWLTIARKV